MSAISDIRHRHLLFRYRRQICRTEKRHSDIGSVLISTSEFIPISDFALCRFESAPLGMVREGYNTELLRLSLLNGMSDIGYRTKFHIRYNVGLRSLSPILEVSISGSVRYCWSRISDKCPPMVGLMQLLMESMLTHASGCSGLTDINICPLQSMLQLDCSIWGKQGTLPLSEPEEPRKPAHPLGVSMNPPSWTFPMDPDTHTGIQKATAPLCSQYCTYVAVTSW